LPGKVSKINEQCLLIKDKWNRMLFRIESGTQKFMYRTKLSVAKEKTKFKFYNVSYRL